MMYVVNCNGKLHGPFGEAQYATRWAELTLLGAATWSVLPMQEIGTFNQAYEKEIESLKDEIRDRDQQIYELEKTNRRLRKPAKPKRHK